MVSTLIADFPSLKYGEYIFDELQRILKKNDKEMRQLFLGAYTAVEVLLTFPDPKKVKYDVSILECICMLLYTCMGYIGEKM